MSNWRADILVCPLRGNDQGPSTNDPCQSGKLKAELAFQGELEGRHSCLPNVALFPIGSRRNADA